MTEEKSRMENLASTDMIVMMALQARLPGLHFVDTEDSDAADLICLAKRAGGYVATLRTRRGPAAMTRLVSDLRAACAAPIDLGIDGGLDAENAPYARATELHLVPGTLEKREPAVPGDPLVSCLVLQTLFHSTDLDPACIAA